MRNEELLVRTGRSGPFRGDKGLSAGVSVFEDGFTVDPVSEVGEHSITSSGALSPFPADCGSFTAFSIGAFPTVAVFGVEESTLALLFEDMTELIMGGVFNGEESRARNDAFPTAEKLRAEGEVRARVGAGPAGINEALPTAEKLRVAGEGDF